MSFLFASSFSNAQETLQRSSLFGFPVPTLLTNQMHPSTPMFCHGTVLSLVEISPEPFPEAGQIDQDSNSSRRADPQLSSTKYLGPKLPISGYTASSVQSMDRASLLCSCAVSDFHQSPGRWPWYTFWVLMRPTSFQLRGEKVHQMAQRCSNFKRLDKEQVLSTHYILNFVFY